MQINEMDRMLTDLLGNETPFSPDFDNLQLPLETIEPEIPPAVVSINVPDGKKMHNGYLLQGGQLSIGKTLERYAMLVLTQDFTFIHIAKDGKVVSRRNNKKKQHGSIVIPDSSSTIEKKQPFTLALQRDQRARILSPEMPVQDVILYEPQPIRASSRRVAYPSINLYTPLLRQFLR